MQAQQYTWPHLVILPVHTPQHRFWTQWYHDYTDICNIVSGHSSAMTTLTSATMSQDTAVPCLHWQHLQHCLRTQQCHDYTDICNTISGHSSAMTTVTSATLSPDTAVPWLHWHLKHCLKWPYQWTVLATHTCSVQTKHCYGLQWPQWSHRQHCGGAVKVVGEGGQWNTDGRVNTKCGYGMRSPGHWPAAGGWRQMGHVVCSWLNVRWNT